jgi:hypothetical protein
MGVHKTIRKINKCTSEEQRKILRAEARRRYYQRNKERIKERNKKYYDKSGKSYHTKRLEIEKLKNPKNKIGLAQLLSE